MNKANIVMLIASLGFSLSSCSFEAKEESTSISTSEESSVASEEEKSSVTSQKEPSLRHYTVSIYQCFYLPKEDKYGDPRYDTKYKVEEFAPFYKDADAFNELESQCHPSGEFKYPHPGGVYMMIAFFYDVTCKREILYGDPVTSNTSIYYYCR